MRELGGEIVRASLGAKPITLTEDDLAMYDQAATTLDPALRTWLEGGRHAVQL